MTKVGGLTSAPHPKKDETPVDPADLAFRAIPRHMRRGSRADAVFANPVRSGRKQPQRIRCGSFRLPPSPQFDRVAQLALIGGAKALDGAQPMIGQSGRKFAQFMGSIRVAQPCGTTKP